MICFPADSMYRGLHRRVFRAERGPIHPKWWRDTCRLLLMDSAGPEAQWGSDNYLLIEEFLRCRRLSNGGQSPITSGEVWRGAVGQRIILDSILYQDEYDLPPCTGISRSPGSTPPKTTLVMSTLRAKE